MSLLLLFRPRRQSVSGDGAGSSSGGGGGGRRLRVFKNPKWMRKTAKVEVAVATLPTVDEVLTASVPTSEFLRYSGSDVPIIGAMKLNNEVMDLLASPYFAVTSSEDWVIPEYLAQCGCVLETYLTPDQIRAEDEELLLLVMAANDSI
jgi:hypothetical protein